MDPPTSAIQKLRKQRDIYRDILWQMAETLGYKKGDRPNSNELLVRLKTRIAPQHVSRRRQLPIKPARSNPAPPPRRQLMPPQNGDQPSATSHRAAQSAESTEPVACIEFELSPARFMNLLGPRAQLPWSRLTKVFPVHLMIAAGSLFECCDGLMRVVGYLPTKATYAVAACLAWKLEEKAFVVKESDMFTYSAEFVVEKLHGRTGLAQMQSERLTRLSHEFKINDMLVSRGVVCFLAGDLRRVRVVDILAHKRTKQIVVEEVFLVPPNAAKRRWHVSKEVIHSAQAACNAEPFATASGAPPLASAASTATVRGTDRKASKSKTITQPEPPKLPKPPEPPKPPKPQPTAQKTPASTALKPHASAPAVLPSCGGLHMEPDTDDDDG